jgi:hypothetical protein
MKNFKVTDITFNRNGNGEPFHIVRFSCVCDDNQLFTNMLAVMPLTDDPDDADVGECFVVDMDNPIKLWSNDDFLPKLATAVKKFANS